MAVIFSKELVKSKAILVLKLYDHQNLLCRFLTDACLLVTLLALIFYWQLQGKCIRRRHAIPVFCIRSVILVNIYLWISTYCLVVVDLHFWLYEGV